MRFGGACDLKEYLEDLGPEDAVLWGQLLVGRLDRRARSALLCSGSEQIPHHHRVAEQDRLPAPGTARVEVIISPSPIRRVSCSDLLPEK